MGDRPDEELLVAWRAGDGRAGSELFHRHFRTLHRFFSGKVESVVEDLIQKTFLRCAESAERVEDPGRFRAYLLAIARNELYMHYRRSAARLDQATLERSALASLGPSPSAVAAKQDEHRLLREALRRIPLDLQLLVELFYWHELSTHELTTVFGVPQGTIKSRLRRAREALRVALEQLDLAPGLVESTLSGLGKEPQ